MGTDVVATNHLLYTSIQLCASLHMCQIIRSIESQMICTYGWWFLFLFFVRSAISFRVGLGEQSPAYRAVSDRNTEAKRRIEENVLTVTCGTCISGKRIENEFISDEPNAAAVRCSIQMEMEFNENNNITLFPWCHLFFVFCIFIFNLVQHFSQCE